MTLIRLKCDSNQVRIDIKPEMIRLPEDALFKPGDTSSKDLFVIVTRITPELYHILF